MTAERARQLSGAYLYEDREYVDGKIKSACGRGHYKVWVQEIRFNNIEATKNYYNRNKITKKIILAIWTQKIY